ncbi:MAG: hypothetical protein A4E56_00181 [Pelotomaculum sp. PtaU1.Bin065]|nr:MAG: hypothetical protein A4E56_00181 [Pelotomaculum sp. PtaU1.Bin065]
MSCMVEMFASNDHLELEIQLNAWLRAKRPRKILSIRFVADGAEYTYAVLILYLPREKHLPK